MMVNNSCGVVLPLQDYTHAARDPKRAPHSSLGFGFAAGKNFYGSPGPGNQGQRKAEK